MNRTGILQDLAQRIQEIELSSHPARQPVYLGSADLELPAGSLVELISTTEGDGSATLALWMARHACAGKALIVADSDGLFYPSAVPWLDWKRCLILRTRARRDVYLAVEQSLRCPAVGAVLMRGEKLSVPVLRRLQFAAEAGGGIGFLLRSAAALATPAFAALRLLVTPCSPGFQPGQSDQRPDFHSGQSGRIGNPAYKNAVLHERQLQIEILRARSGGEGRSFVLELDHETGDVHLFSGLASPATHSRSARTSG
jgi:hypothetical protein